MRKRATEFSVLTSTSTDRSGLHPSYLTNTPMVISDLAICSVSVVGSGSAGTVAVDVDGLKSLSLTQTETCLEEHTQAVIVIMD